MITETLITKRVHHCPPVDLETNFLQGSVFAIISNLITWTQNELPTRYFIHIELHRFFFFNILYLLLHAI